jgi:hypothetical protein
MRAGETYGAAGETPDLRLAQISTLPHITRTGVSWQAFVLYLFKTERYRKHNQWLIGKSSSLAVIEVPRLDPGIVPAIHAAERRWNLNDIGDH